MNFLPSLLSSRVVKAVGAPVASAASHFLWWARFQIDPWKGVR